MGKSYYDLKVLKVRNCKEVAMDRKAWNVLSGESQNPHMVVVLMEEEAG
jgi:hypothetical protein